MNSEMPDHLVLGSWRGKVIMSELIFYKASSARPTHYKI